MRHPENRSSVKIVCSLQTVWVETIITPLWQDETPTDFKDIINVLDTYLPDSAWTFESQEVSQSKSINLSDILSLERIMSWNGMASMYFLLIINVKNNFK